MTIRQLKNTTQVLSQQLSFFKRYARVMYLSKSIPNAGILQTVSRPDLDKLISAIQLAIKCSMSDNLFVQDIGMKMGCAVEDLREVLLSQISLPIGVNVKLVKNAFLKTLVDLTDLSVSVIPHKNSLDEIKVPKKGSIDPIIESFLHVKSFNYSIESVPAFGIHANILVHHSILKDLVPLGFEFKHSDAGISAVEVFKQISPDGQDYLVADESVCISRQGDFISMSIKLNDDILVRNIPNYAMASAYSVLVYVFSKQVSDLVSNKQKHLDAAGAKVSDLMAEVVATEGLGSLMQSLNK